MAALFFRVVINDSRGLLLCVMYRPPRQGRSALDFLMEELDTMLQQNKCSQVMILGDLNFHLQQDAFNSLLMVQGLTNHVSFPTHERGGSLDPVLADLPDSSIVCHQLGTVGISDHHAVLASVKLDIAREAAAPRTIWLWEQADWASLRHNIVRLDWDALLISNTEKKARVLTTKLLALQQQHVPSRRYLGRPSDPAWFGYRCRAAAEAKQVRYKRRSTHYSWAQHRVACRRLTATCRWARRQQREDMRRKLCGSGIGHKTWWRLVKEQQGTGHRDTVPPLTRLDRKTATSNDTVADIQMTRGQVERLMREVEENKATGLDDISPRLLKRCASELSGPLTSVFRAYLMEHRWPSIWKEARVVPAHKKNSQSEPSNYRPISLLSVVGKLLEQASQRVSALHRMSGNLDSRGILTLYNAQIRACMEYSALSWMSSAPTHLQRLDALQRRALRLLVLLTFDDAVNDLKKGLYKDLINVGRKDPNGCPIASIMYVSHKWTEYSQDLYRDLFENGLLNLNGSPILSTMYESRADRLLPSRLQQDVLNLQDFINHSFMTVYENNPLSCPYTLDYRLFHDCILFHQLHPRLKGS
ncbi:uncharacterized protein LOC135110721 [Scylla paramamosain]|uniref:uncharacterized protein LOC135110721 n=1 Tax=Scylla paramamosain TaxID=85552 RepID=UPI003083AEA4